MKEKNIDFIVEGKDAEENARRLAAYIRQEWGVTPAIQSFKPEMDNFRGVDPVALVAIVLSIPSVILAALDLADRIKKKKKVDQLLEWGKKNKIPLTLRRPDGTIIHLHNAEPGGAGIAALLDTTISDIEPEKEND
jgi:hypothetical protein